MGRIDEIVNELLVVDSKISSLDILVQREGDKIANTMNKAHSLFGEQQAGQQFVGLLQRALNSTVLANGSLQVVKEKIRIYIQSIKK